MIHTKEITIMFYDTERGWVEDTMEVDSGEKADTEENPTHSETYGARHAYYV